MGQLVRNNTNVQTSTIEVLDKLLKYAEVFAESTIVPKHYRGNKGSILIVLQTAYRMNLDPMMVMQGTYEIHGKLGMTSAFAIALANTSGLIIGGIRYKIENLGADIENKSEKFRNIQVTAYTNLKSNGEEISYTIGMKEAIAEGWTSNTKYKSLPELMLRYRAATLLIRTHVPEILNGMHMTEELEDIGLSVSMKQANSNEDVGSRVKGVLDNFLTNNEEIITNTIEEDGTLEALSTDLCLSSKAVNCLKLHSLIAQYNVSKELVSKWCIKANVNTLEDLDENKIIACIEHIERNFADNTIND